MPLMAHPFVSRFGPPNLSKGKCVVVAGDEIVGAIEGRKTSAEAMVDGIDLFAVAGRIVEGSAESVTDERLEAAAGVAIVDLRRVVGGGPGR